MLWVALGIGSLAIGGLALSYLLVTRGRTRRMTRAELADRINRYGEVLEPRGVAYGQGVRREASFGIDTLRNAARRGEWGLFWAWPFVMSGFGFGVMFFAVALSAAIGHPVFAIAGAIACLPVGLFGWFAAWAALYTNIDLHTDDS